MARISCCSIEGNILEEKASIAKCEGTLCYAIQFEGVACCYVVPLEQPSSRCEAFVAMAVAYGGGDPLREYGQSFQDMFGEDAAVFVEIMNDICMDSYIIEMDRKVMLEKMKLSQPVPLLPPKLSCLRWYAELRQGSEISLTMTVNPLTKLYSLVLQPCCSSGGIQFDPETLCFSPAVSFAKLRVKALKPGTHAVRFLAHGANAHDVLLPMHSEITVISHEIAILESAVDTLYLLLQTCEAYSNLSPFITSINRLFHSFVSQATIFEVLNRISERALFSLFFETVKCLNHDLLEKICNETFHGIQLCHLCMLFGELSIIRCLLRCINFDPNTGNSCVAAGLVVNGEKDVLELLDTSDICCDGYLQGSTALCLAITQNNTNVALRLLEVGVDVNKWTLTGETPLYLCFNSHVKQLNLANAILQTEKVQWEGPHGKKNSSCLAFAASACLPESVQCLLTAGCPIGKDFCSPLLSVINHHYENDLRSATAEILADAACGCLDLVGASGCTVLQAACAKADKVTVQVILCAGASPDILDEKNENCLHYLMRNTTEEETVLLSILTTILTHCEDADCDTADAEGKTPLHYAAGCRSHRCLNGAISLFLEAGFVITSDRAGFSPLHYSLMSYNRNEAVILQLLDAIQADSEGVGLLAPSFLCLAVEHGMTGVVSRICNKFLNTADDSWLHCEGDTGNTPLLTALLYDSTDDKSVQMALAILQTKKCNLRSMRDRPYSSPIHIAACRCYTSVVDVLLKEGEFSDLSVFSDYTPLSALLRVPPYDTPDFQQRLSDITRKSTVLDIFMLLLLRSPDPDALIVVPESPTGYRTILQVLCDQCRPVLVDNFIRTKSPSWTWDRSLSVVEHPLSLALHSKGDYHEKDSILTLLLPCFSNDLSPAMLMHLVQSCITYGFRTHLTTLITLQRSIIQAVLPGGKNLLQLALVSTVSSVEKKVGVCEALISAGVNVNVISANECGTPLQEVIANKMWKTLDLMCKASVKLNASLTTPFNTTPPIQLVLRKVDDFPAEATAAAVSLISTGTVKDLEGKEQIADICCSKGIAKVLYPMQRCGLITIPSGERMGGEELKESLCHKAACAGILSTEAKLLFGPGPTIAALADVGYLEAVIEMEDEKGRTPFLKAMANGAFVAAQILLKRGSNPLARAKGSSAAHLMITSHYVTDETASKCLGLLSDPHSLAQMRTDSILHHACKRGFMQCVTWLLSIPGINPNGLDPNGNTPLHALILSKLNSKYKGAIATKLLQHQNIQPTAHVSPLHIALSEPKVERSLVKALLCTNSEKLAANIIDATVDRVSTVAKAAQWLLDVLAALQEREVKEQNMNTEQVKPTEEDLKKKSKSGRSKKDKRVELDSPKVVTAKALECFNLLVNHPKMTTAAAQGSTAALHILARHTNVSVVLQASFSLLAIGAKCCVVIDGSTALQQAMSAFSTEVHLDKRTFNYLSTLMDSSEFDASVTDKQQKTLLHLCLDIANEEVVIQLAERLLTVYTLHYDACDINCVDCNGYSILSTLVRSSLSLETQRHIVLLLIQVPDIEVKLLGMKGNILHYVVTQLSPHVLKMCLSSPALRLNLCNTTFWEEHDHKGRTVLHCILCNDGVDMVANLEQALQYSIAIPFTARDDEKLTPLLYAVRYKKWEAVHLLLSEVDSQSVGVTELAPCGASVLHWLLEFVPSQQEAIRWTGGLAKGLEKAYGSLDKLRDVNLETILHKAARRGFGAVCVMLIEDYRCGILNFNGYETPLHALLKSDCHPKAREVCALEILAVVKQNIDVVDKQLMTPLMLAARNSDLEICCELLRKGSSCAMLDCKGKSVLYHAMYPKTEGPDYEKIAMCILQNMSDHMGDFIDCELMLPALERGSYCLIKKMVEVGFNIAVPLKDGKTIIEHALLVEDRTAHVRPSIACYLVMHVRNTVNTISGIEFLRRTDEQHLCEALSKGQRPDVLANWLERTVIRSGPTAAEVTNTVVENINTYYKHCSISTQVAPTTVRLPYGGTGSWNEDEENVFLTLVRQCPDLLKSSDTVLNRYIAVLLYARLGSRVITNSTESALLESEAMTVSIVSALPPVSLLLLCTSSLDAQDAILPPNGVFSSASGGLRNLFEAAIVFSSSEVMKPIALHCKGFLISNSDDSLEKVAIEKGRVEAVVAVLESKCRHGRRLDRSAIDSFFRRPLSERKWEVFEVLLNLRTPLTEQGILYMLEQGAIGALNSLGDTVLHLLAVNKQCDLLEGLFQHLPHFNMLPISTETKNVFGKKAYDYASPDMLRLLYTMRPQTRTTACSVPLRRSPIFKVLPPSCSPVPPSTPPRGGLAPRMTQRPLACEQVIRGPATSTAPKSSQNFKKGKKAQCCRRGPTVGWCMRDVPFTVTHSNNAVGSGTDVMRKVW